MLILLHIIYIYTEYLWSYIVNRNRLLDEPHENESNCEEYEKNTEFGASRDDRKVVSSSNEGQSKENDDTSSDNLEFDADECPDRFLFSDSVEEFEEAVYDIDTNKLSFFPPVYVQRYVTVVNILKDERWRNEIKKVVDIGCAELGFFKFLKDIDGLEKILEIDINKKLLQEYSYRIQPWVSDYLKDRISPLEVTLLCGNVTRPDRHLEGVDAVVAIELIEHLFPPDLDALPFNIFGVIKPRIAIFTTPNEEFNVLFDNFSGFRHYDHKFEWKRREFESWANNICSRFPFYEVNFFGIGPGPKGNDELGCCSQGCVFIRTSLPKENYFTKPLSNYEEYEVIDHVDYPYKRDARSQDKITLDDAENFMNLAVRIGDYTNGDRIEIPLGVIFMRVYKTCKSLDKLKQILEESGYEIEKDKDGDYIVIVPESCFDSDTASEDQSEFKDESIQYVDYVEGASGLISDWDNVEQDDVSWLTADTLSNDHKNFSSNELSGDKQNGDYKIEQIVNLDGEIGVDVEGLLNNSDLFDENLKLDISVSEFNLDCTDSLDDSNLIELEYNLGIDSVNSDNISFGSQESFGMHTEYDNLRPTYSTTEDRRSPLKHSVKFLSSEECMSYDMSEIKRTSLNDSNDLSVLELKKSVFENLGEKEIESVLFNSENVISGENVVNKEPPVSYGIPGKASCSFSHEVNNSKNFDSINISSLESNLVQNIHKGDCLGDSNLEVLSDKKNDKDPALLYNDNVTEHNSGQFSFGDSFKVAVTSCKNKIDHFNCKDLPSSTYSNDRINKENLSVDSIYAVDECVEGVQEEMKKIDIKCPVMTEDNVLVKNNVFMTSSDISDCVKKETACLSMKTLGRDINKTVCTNIFASTKPDSSHLISDSGTSSNPFKNYLLSGDVNGKCIDVSKEERNHIIELNNKCDRPLASEVSVNSCKCDNSDLNKKSNLSDSNSISDNCTNVEKNVFRDVKTPPSSVLDSDKDAASSFIYSECSDVLDSDNKGSERSDFLSMPSNLTLSQLKSNTNNVTMFDELINSDVLIDKKNPSEFSLCIDENIEKVIKTHNLETDKSENLIHSVGDELFKSEPSTFSLSEKSYDRLLKSHSLSHFLQHSSSFNDECNKFINPSYHPSKDITFLSSSSPADYQKLHPKVAERFDEKKVLTSNENCQEEYGDDDDNDESSLKDFLHAGMERQDSFSPDKAGDSGYPNSNSGRDMEMDLTPEQVKEIMTEGESSLENSPPDSPVEEAPVAILPHPPVLHLGDNVENGDVANNNRDGEGNNMIGEAAIVGEPLEFHALIDQPQEVPLMAVAEVIGRNEEVDNKGSDNLNNKSSENDSISKNENKDVNPKAGAQKKAKPNLSMSVCMPDSSSSVSDDRAQTIKRSKTFLDEPSTFKSIADKGNSETNSCSCPDSTLKLIDETEINCVTYCNNLSNTDITNWESFKMVESNDVRELRKYAAWLAEKSSMCSRDSRVDFWGSVPEYFRDLQTDSVPSCSFSNETLSASSVQQTEIPPNYHISPITSVSEARLTLPEVIRSMPFAIFDEMLDSVIRDIVEEFFSPNLEPFADWLLQIQFEIVEGEGNDGDRVQSVGNHGLIPLDEGNNTSEQVLTVQADVKGGGDSSAEQ